MDPGDEAHRVKVMVFFADAEISPPKRRARPLSKQLYADLADVHKVVLDLGEHAPNAFLKPFQFVEVAVIAAPKAGRLMDNHTFGRAALDPDVLVQGPPDEFPGPLLRHMRAAAFLLLVPLERVAP